MVDDGEATPVRLKFVKEDGAWKFDDPSAFAEYDREFRKLVKEEEMAEDDLIAEALEAETGKKVTEQHWKPMPK